MPVQITIRGVPEQVRNELASRAALAGKSMQQYLRAELERLASRPPIERVLAEIFERKRATPRRLKPREILAHRFLERVERDVLETGELATMAAKVANRELDPYTAASGVLERAFDAGRIRADR